MPIQCIDTSESINLSESIFETPFNQGLIHEVVTAYLAGGRQGSKSTKSRSDVRGGGKKPWRQKGTGRARAGTSRSPIWVGGGHTFAFSPRDYSKKVNKKAYRAAIKSILATLLREERFHIAAQINVDTPKTKTLLELIKPFNFAGSLLIVTPDVSENLQLAARNLPHLHVCDLRALNPLSLVSFDHVLLTREALAQLEEKLQ